MMLLAKYIPLPYLNVKKENRKLKADLPTASQYAVAFRADVSVKIHNSFRTGCLFCLSLVRTTLSYIIIREGYDYVWERAEGRKLPARLTLEAADKQFGMNTGCCLRCWREQSTI